MQEPPEHVEELAHDVIGAAIEVHKHLGPGYLENVYEQAMCRELNLRNITFESQHTFDLDYKDSQIGQGRVDLLVEDGLVVELKAVDTLARIHTVQTLSYLKALQCPLGLLINFNVPILKEGLERVVHS